MQSAGRSPRKPQVSGGPQTIEWAYKYLRSVECWNRCFRRHLHRRYTRSMQIESKAPRQPTLEQAFSVSSLVFLPLKGVFAVTKAHFFPKTIGDGSSLSAL